MTRTGEKDQIHHDVAGKDIQVSNDARYKEYRRKWEENPKELIIGEFPLHLDIEVTSYCNLRCPFCHTTYANNKIKNGYISFDLVKKMLDEGAENGLSACKFNIRGEPLLHPDLPKFVAYAKEKGVLDVFFNTNAALLTEEKAIALIEAGLDRLTVSFEGCEPEMYEKSRVGAKFQAVVDNVVRLRTLREKMGRSNPKIRVQAVLTPEMEPIMDSYVDFWKDKVDQVSYNDMLDNVPKDVEPVPSPWICPFPYQRLEIYWDGTVTVCYNDIYGALSVGNASSRSLKDCWQTGLTELREKHRNGRAHEIPTCSACPLRAYEMSKLSEG